MFSTAGVSSGSKRVFLVDVGNHADHVLPAPHVVGQEVAHATRRSGVHLKPIGLAGRSVE